MTGGAGQFGPPDGQAVSLVGRDREQALLRHRLAAALAGRGGLVLVGGEAGIGKTALARTLAREAAERGALALTGHCYDLAETPPYGPWIELLEQVPATPDRSPLPALAGPAGPVAGVASQAALFAQVRDFFAALAAQRPLILVLDDLHWADPASLDLLRSLARQLAAHPLLLVATYRADELSRRHPLSQLLPVLVREAEAARLDLRRLEQGDVRALVAARYRLLPADEARLVAYLQGHAEGNPFYLGELLRTLEEERLLRPEGTEGWALGDLARLRVPALLRQVIDGRVGRLGEEIGRLLALAAVIGQEVPLDLWERVAEVEEEALLAVVARATEARLAEEMPDGARVRFVHALVRQALYEGIVPSRRRAWHRAVGEALAAQPTPASGSPDPDVVSHHFRQAGDPRAVEWLVQAGERAQRAYAWLMAAERFEAALALLEQGGAGARERGWLLFRLGRLRRYDDAHAAIAALEGALRLATAAGDQALLAYSRFYLGLPRCFAGDYGRGVADLEAGAAAVDALSPAERAEVVARRVGVDTAVTATHHATLAAYLAAVGRHADALLVGTRALHELAAAADSGAVDRAAGADAYYGLAGAHAATGRPAEAHAAYANARALHRDGNAYLVAVWATEELLCVTLPYEADRLAAREALAAEAERALARASSVRANVPRSARLPLLAVEGAWSEARQLALTVRAALPKGYFAMPTVLGWLAYHQGDAALAWAIVREVLPAGPATAPGETSFDSTLPMQRLAAALALDAGDLPTARAWLAAHDRWLAWSGAILWRADGHLGWAAYHRAAGDLALAHEHAERALAHASEPRQPLALLAAHRTLGELDSVAGRHAEALAHLDEALTLAVACAAPYERALTLLALADLWAEGGNRAAARAALDEARAICTPLGAAPALGRAAALAARLDDPQPPAAVAYPAGLSAREVEVLRHLAAGRTNREIAQTLYLSTATVNNHVARILAKVGASNRAGAAAFALRHGLA